jgi:hypothetical protein
MLMQTTHEHGTGQDLDIAVRPCQKVRLAVAVGSLHQHFQDIHRPVSEALAENESLILRKAIDTFQEPPGHVVPLNQEDGRFVAMALAQLAHGRSKNNSRAAFGGERKATVRPTGRTVKGTKTTAKR